MKKNDSKKSLFNYNVGGVKQSVSASRHFSDKNVQEMNMQFMKLL